MKEPREITDPTTKTRRAMLRLTAAGALTGLLAACKSSKNGAPVSGGGNEDSGY